MTDATTENGKNDTIVVCQQMLGYRLRTKINDHWVLNHFNMFVSATF